jgi:hypothetical protein
MDEVIWSWRAAVVLVVSPVCRYAESFARLETCHNLALPNAHG